MVEILVILSRRGRLSHIHVVSVVVMRKLWWMTCLPVLAACAAVPSDSRDDYGDRWDSGLFAQQQISERIRIPGDLSKPGFRYDYYDDWSGKEDVVFELAPDAAGGRLQANLTVYTPSVFFQVGDIYKTGIRSEAGIIAHLHDERYQADEARCPELPRRFDDLYREMKYQAGQLPQRGAAAFRESAPVFRYYFRAADMSLNLDVARGEGPLYRLTEDTVSYVRRCGVKEGT